MNRYGEIYCITNKVNNKIYIGQALIPEGEISASHKRFKRHISDSKSGRNSSPLFHNAIKKYGYKSFTVTILIKCNAVYLDDYETMFISMFDSTNKSIGYNIQLGGHNYLYLDQLNRNKRLSISIRNSYQNNPHLREKHSDALKEVWKNEEYRKKGLEHLREISLNKSPKELPESIYKVMRNNTLVGYMAQLIIEGKVFSKSFSSSSYSLDEKLEMAINALTELKKEHKNNLYKKNQELPKNISYRRNNNGEITGYMVHLQVEGKRRTKTFSSKKMTMEEKLKLAIQKLEEMKN